VVGRRRSNDAGPERRFEAEEPAGPIGDRSLPFVSRLDPAPKGHGLPIPPLIPTVAAFCLLIGISLGYGLVPKPAATVVSSPAPSRTDLGSIQSPSPTPGRSIEADPGSSAQAEQPPVGGLSLKQALDKLHAADPAISASNVISARVARYSQVLPGDPNATGEWVWAFVVPVATYPMGSGRLDCLYFRVVGSVANSPCPSAVAPVDVSTTETIILDYRTGVLIDFRIPA
jgi:hypothetical protein